MEDQDTEESTKMDLVCRVCLATTRCMYSLQALSLASTYAALTGDTLTTGQLPRVACAMCVAQLRSAHRLMNRCQRANDFLAGLLQEKCEITPGVIKESSGWEAKLDFVRVHFSTNYCDLYINREITETERDQEAVKPEGDAETDINMATEPFKDDREEDSLKSEEDETLSEQNRNVAYDQETLNGTGWVKQNFEVTSSDFLDMDDSEYNREATPRQRRENSGMMLDISPSSGTDPNPNNETVNGKRNFISSSDISDSKTMTIRGGQKKRKIHLKLHLKPMSSESDPDENDMIDRSGYMKVDSDISSKKRCRVPKRNLAESLAERNVLLKKYFDVQSLSLQEQRAELEKAKLNSNYLECPFKCEFCYKGFYAGGTFSKHMAKHKKSNGSQECPVCHIWIDDFGTLRRHVTNHASLYNCKLCPIITRHKQTAILHAQWHRGAVFSCDQCNETFSRKSSLQSHIRTQHPVGNQSCPLCGYSYIGENGVKWHLQLRHPGETVPADGPRCVVCDAIFATEEARDRHDRVAHVKCERNAQPHGYPRRVKGRSLDGHGGSLDRRLKVKPRSLDGRRRADVAKDISYRNAADAPCVCNDCEERFTTPQGLRQHVLKAHGTAAVTALARKPKSRYQCDMCARFFQCTSKLQDHMDVHNAAASHACPDCGKTYKTRMRMEMHRKLHTARFVCPLCQRVFNSLGNRDRHYTYVHSTERTVKCTYCTKVFKNNDCRRTHEKYVHLKMPWPSRARSRKRARAES